MKQKIVLKNRGEAKNFRSRIGYGAFSGLEGDPMVGGFKWCFLFIEFSTNLK